ncbi:MAG: hypothetical protein IKR52_08870 [Paludibacteraceae bacterium]|nr:hypothetical protein [Paludibacteraceae bacterium]
METTNIIITSIATLLGVLGGGTSILFWKQDKKNKELQNEITAISEWKELYLLQKKKNVELEEKVQWLENEVYELRKEVLNKMLNKMLNKKTPAKKETPKNNLKTRRHDTKHDTSDIPDEERATDAAKGIGMD